MTRIVCLMPVLMVVTLVSLPAYLATAQTDTVELQVKLGAGEVVYATTTGTLDMNLAAGTLRSVTAGRAEGRRAVRILDVDSDGAMLTEVTIEDYRVTIDGKTEDRLFSPMMMKVTPDGRVLARLQGAEHVEAYPHALPGRPVKVGDTWTHQTKIEESGLKGQGTATYTLEAIDRFGDARVARVRVKTEGTITGAGPVDLVLAGQTRVSGTIRGATEFLWSLDTHRLVKSTSDIAMDVNVDMTILGQSNRGRITFKGTKRDEALAAAVVVPSVPADLLITPGKGIGSATLETVVPDLTSRLGQPLFREFDLAYLAKSFRWPNGLVGYLDDADIEKLVGLEIADRRYRTEKGVGYGSSQGAVMLAHGLTPRKADMSIARRGTVRVLIYNDQGIAFCIMADRRSGAQTVPIGTVDAITIFPPGTAAKIFPLP